ncbi:GNAT family N-acetyltransferase [Oceanirhabdus sp. W0125-5]|uniref:GNAT family N-acetyltransferase n=1 Tax=Oceanirhabdus sp. W0125-5 TaxID=2999116 RepID=UPI0022F2C52E|nr:GNAT family N-acetyltransferase [Oceanirhabdus sp. W0125-5]WBW96326.1 GNAT family N-acetyltransferase [Oceanirhabdus sp. W0125-5]
MVCYRDIPFSEVSIIKEVWERNRKFHEDISKDFKYIYSDIVFEERINGFSVFDKEHIKITLAEDEDSGILLGYCISAFEGNQGETHSLHVVEESRGTGIGKELMKGHIKWLKANGCEDITLAVSCDNNNTIEFYKTMGFRPNTIEMRLKK